MQSVTIDDVYEIAAEVAEETITRFLQNLVKLVPVAEDTIDTIRQSQYDELKNYRQSKPSLRESTNDRALSSSARPIVPVEDTDMEFAAIAHPGRPDGKEADVMSVLNEIPLENSELATSALNSPCD